MANGERVAQVAKRKDARNRSRTRRSGRKEKHEVGCHVGEGGGTTERLLKLEAHF